MKIKYTKINKILEINNDMVHNYYYIYYGKIYNDEGTRYRKFRYIEYFDIFDLQEYFEKENITKNDIKEYANNLENSYLMSIKNYDDTKNLKEFYEYCNDTIHNYNRVIGY